MSAAEREQPVEVQMIADLACPWCYIGRRRLDRAVAMRPGRAVRLRWWPFLLNPHLPPEGMDRETYTRLKFGGAAAAERVYRRIQEAGREEGIDFAFGRMTRTPNTVRAQRLLLVAETKGLGEALAVRLFEDLFVGGKDIGDDEVLLDAAASVGLDRAAAAGALDVEGPEDPVLRGHREAERLGVRGVPVFVVGGRHAVSGAQPPEVLAGLLDLGETSSGQAEPSTAAV